MDKKCPACGRVQGQGQLFIRMPAEELSDYADYPPVTQQEIDDRVRQYKNSWAHGEPFDVGPLWHTPLHYIEAIKELMGDIDIDPASNEIAQKRIQAKVYYTSKQDSHIYPWYGRLFLNPNYSNLEAWIDKTIREYRTGNVTEGIILTHTMQTYAPWFSKIGEVSSAICIISKLTRWAADHALDLAATEACGLDFHPKYKAHGNVFFYLGGNVDGFKRIFSKFGVCYVK